MRYVIALIVLAAIVSAIYIAGDRNRANRDELARVAKANQNIAERRATDAKYDKTDAAATCKLFGLEWVFADGKSSCQ